MDNILTQDEAEILILNAIKTSELYDEKTFDKNHLSENMIDFVINQVFLVVNSEFIAAFKKEATLAILANYIILKDTEEKTIKYVESKLQKSLNKNEITWNILSNLKNEICFRDATTGSRNTLVVKYNIDEDKNISYKLDFGGIYFPLTLNKIKYLFDKNTDVENGLNCQEITISPNTKKISLQLSLVVKE